MSSLITTIYMTAHLFYSGNLTCLVSKIFGELFWITKIQSIKCIKHRLITKLITGMDEK
jgi:hypothetical protein